MFQIHVTFSSGSILIIEGLALANVAGIVQVFLSGERFVRVQAGEKTGSVNSVFISPLPSGKNSTL